MLEYKLNLDKHTSYEIIGRHEEMDYQKNYFDIDNLDMIRESRGLLPEEMYDTDNL